MYAFGDNYVYNSGMITRHHIAPNRPWNCCSRIFRISLNYIQPGLQTAQTYIPSTIRRVTTKSLERKHISAGGSPGEYLMQPEWAKPRLHRSCYWTMALSFVQWHVMMDNINLINLFYSCCAVLLSFVYTEISSVFWANNRCFDKLLLRNGSIYYIAQDILIIFCRCFNNLTWLWKQTLDQFGILYSGGWLGYLSLHYPSNKHRLLKESRHVERK